MHVENAVNFLTSSKFLFMTTVITITIKIDSPCNVQVTEDRNQFTRDRQPAQPRTDVPPPQDFSSGDEEERGEEAGEREFNYYRGGGKRFPGWFPAPLRP